MGDDGPKCAKCGAGWNCQSISLFNGGHGELACVICGSRTGIRRGRLEKKKVGRGVKHPAAEIEQELRERMKAERQEEHAGI